MTVAPAGVAPRRFCFLLIPRFSMMAFTCAIEPLRAANRISGLPVYQWRLVSADGKPVEASNGIAIMPHSGIATAEPADIVIVCAGLDPQHFLFPQAAGWLRRSARMGAQVGGLGTGAYLMAKAGLLDGYRCTVHWENIAGFHEMFPDIDVTANLFEIDRDRITCAGGTAAIDLMLHLIDQDHGGDLRSAVSEQFIHAQPRSANSAQRMPLRQRVGVSHPRLLAAIAEIEANLGEPLSRADLADRVGISARQLERLFRIHLRSTPSRYYLEARLKRAQILLSQTSMSVLEVAVACGFASASHFAKCYRTLFGRPPRQERTRETEARHGGLKTVAAPGTF